MAIICASPPGGWYPSLTGSTLRKLLLWCSMYRKIKIHFLENALTSEPLVFNPRYRGRGMAEDFAPARLKSFGSGLTGIGRFLLSAFTGVSQVGGVALKKEVA
jgi:hypothetical protein